MKVPINKLALLASGVSSRNWISRNCHETRPDQRLDASAQRVRRWHDEFAREVITAYAHVNKRSGKGHWQLKTALYKWLDRKHAVLKDALHQGDILQIDVLDAVVCRFSSQTPFLIATDSPA